VDGWQSGWSCQSCYMYVVVSVLDRGRELLISYTLLVIIITGLVHFSSVQLQSVHSPLRCLSPTLLGVYAFHSSAVSPPSCPSTQTVMSRMPRILINMYYTGYSAMRNAAK
jgi:hypothetical protein